MGDMAVDVQEATLEAGWEVVVEPSLECHSSSTLSEAFHSMPEFGEGDDAEKEEVLVYRV
jgi:Uri superfamily endonuclease